MNLTSLRTRGIVSSHPMCFAFLLGAAALLSVSSPAQQPEPWKQIPVPPLHAFHPVPPTRVTLPNGVQIFLEEDHELPFISGFIRVRGGSIQEPADKAGLTDLLGDTWRTSGTAAKSGDALDDELALKAASIETDGAQASTSLSWSSFAKDFDGVFADSVDLLLHPAFKQDKLDLAKQEAASSILRRNDNAASIAGREALEIAYGKTNPYARESELATIGAVTLADLQQWHDKTVVGSNIIIGIIGDFNTKQMEAKLREAFAKLPKGEKMATPKIDFSAPKPGVYFANKSDVNQSNIFIVGLGTEQSNPDYYALSVMNEIFGGGFGSRLFQDVRTRRGLAYSVGGRFGASYDHPGIFYLNAGTKSVSTVPATQAILEDTKALRSSPPTEEEVRKAKEQILNAFIFKYDSPEKILSQQVTLAVYDYPADFLDKFRAGIDKVTPADVQRVANKYVDADKLAIVIVGNGAEIKPELSGLGTVTNLDLTIPGAPAGDQ